MNIEKRVTLLDVFKAFLQFIFCSRIHIEKRYSAKEKKKIGITGNIGAGKSAVMRILRSYRKVHLILTDDLAKEMMAESVHTKKIAEILGDVLTNGILDKEKISSIIYSDESKRLSLNAYVHPMVKQRIEMIIRKTNKKYFFVESALIFEAGWEDFFDTLVIVNADSVMQRKRLAMDRGMTNEKIDEILRTQSISPERFAKAHHVIENSGSLYDLKESVAVFVKKFMDPIVAVDAGTYDPFTFGHMDVLEKSLRISDIVTVLVAYNSKKSCMFTVAERVAMIKEATKDMGNVLVDSYEGLVIEYARDHGSTKLIRGYRGESDLLAENDLKKVNNFLNPSIETVFIQADEHMEHISSSAVREVFALSKDWEEHIIQMVPFGIMHELRVKKYTPLLRERFVNFIKRCAPSYSPIADSLFNDLVSKHSEPHRAYHTLVHLYEIFQDFELIKQFLENPDTVEIGTFVHDDIYDVDPVLSKTNEQRSAIESRRIADRLELKEPFKTSVYNIVLVTDHNEHQPKTTDEKFMVDLDLAILGKDDARYDRYEQEIRKEYSFVPAKTFYSIRKGILERFLARENIYYTEFFRNKYQAQARINLQRAIDSYAKYLN